LYSGEQFDSKIGQQYLRARYYDPATGRFNRLDPFFGNLNDPQSLHKYLYTHDDPVTYTDINGKFVTIAICVTAVIGAGVRGLYDSKSTGFLAGFTSHLMTASTGLAVATGVTIDSMALLYRYGTPYVTKEYAKALIELQREKYISNTQKTMFDMWKRQAPAIAQTTTITDNDYMRAGRLIGEIYTDMVWTFLDEHSFIEPGQGERFKWETKQSNPFCADWTEATFEALQRGDIHLLL
jgi:RHS repeat-associated protein